MLLLFVKTWESSNALLHMMNIYAKSNKSEIYFTFFSTDVSHSLRCESKLNVF